MSDFRRYARQVILREVGVNGQAVLADSTVMVIGIGGLGTAATQYLAAAGVGTLLLVDRDRVESSNLQRQVLFRETDVGQPKTAAAQAQLTALNPAVQTRCLDADAGLAAIIEADVVLDCTDNFPSRFAINAACVAARRPLVSGAAIRFEGQLAVFDLRRGGPCYRCLFDDSGAAAETCEEAGILGPVVGTIGTLQALAALKLLLGLDAQAGFLNTWDALALRWQSHRITQDPHCPVCGTAHV